MRCAYCPNCDTYPTELLILPVLKIDDETSEPIRADQPIVLTGTGEVTGRYEDGTTGVTEEERQAAEDDDTPACATCKGGIEWRTVEEGVQAAIEAGKAARGGQIGGGATGSEWVIRGEEESPEARFNRLVAKLWSTSFRELPALVETLTIDQRRELGRHFEALAQNAARVGAYLEWRGGAGYDQGHEKAVKEQNKVARKVRQAQGYHNTPDLNF